MTVLSVGTLPGADSCVGCRAVALGLVSTLAIGLTACGVTTRADAVQPNQPAVLVSPTGAARAELRQAVSEGLHGAPVTLSDDALTRDNDLVIERTLHRDTAGHPILGRSTEKPEHFRLFERGGRCVLVQERTGRRWVLGRATCAPARTGK